MKGYYGQPRRLNDEKVAIVLNWQRTRKTMRQWARELGVSPTTARDAAFGRGAYRTRVLRGRPRKLSDEQIAVLQQWQRDRRTARQLASDLGVSLSVVASALQKRGIYKAAPAEERRAAILARRALFERLRKCGLD